MTVLFVSDIHLSSQRPDIVRAFLDFLATKATEAERLYILGDLFEAWIGDDDPSSLASDVKIALKELSDTGVNVFIQHGNRDFTLGKRFLSETDAQLISDEFILEYNQTSALLMHGDSLCTDDVDYQRFRKKSRHPLYLWFLTHLPLRMRQRVAAKWRRQSQQANRNKPSEIMDVNAEAVATVIDKHQVRFLVHGHTHRPFYHKEDGFERIVLGDWNDEAWCLTLDETGFSLESWKIL